MAQDEFTIHVFLEGLNDYWIIKEYLNTNLDIWTFVLKEVHIIIQYIYKLILYTSGYIV